MEDENLFGDVDVCFVCVDIVWLLFLEGSLDGVYAGVVIYCWLDVKMGVVEIVCVFKLGVMFCGMMFMNL